MNANLSVQDLRKIATGMQNRRLLTLSFPEGDAPYDILLANRLEGEESLSRDFQFVVEILSDKATLDPKDFVGKQICVKLLRDDGSFRYFNGYIFTFRLVKTDGGIAFYEADMGLWMRCLRLRKNNRLFLELATRGQSATIFEDYGTLPVTNDTTEGPRHSLVLREPFRGGARVRRRAAGGSASPCHDRAVGQAECRVTRAAVSCVFS